MKAIAITKIWNHRTQKEIQPGQEFEMLDQEVLALIEIKQAKPVTEKPVQDSEHEQTQSTTV